MNPAIWGPHYWFTFHTIAMTYPLNPNDITKKKYYDFFSNVPLFIPNHSIGSHFIKLLDKYPIEPYLNNRDSLMKWVHFIHNQINKKLNKPEISFSKSLELYNDNYKDKETIKKENIVKKKHYYQIGFLVALFFLILYYK